MFEGVAILSLPRNHELVIYIPWKVARLNTNLLVLLDTKLERETTHGFRNAIPAHVEFSVTFMKFMSFGIILTRVCVWLDYFTTRRSHYQNLNID